MDIKQFIETKSEQFKFTFQDKLKLKLIDTDLTQWGEVELEKLWDESVIGKSKGKQAKEKVISNLVQKYEQLKQDDKDYKDFNGSTSAKENTILKIETKEETILGSCPVASEKTRCCNLLTLDAVKQCGFGCTYCSIQSFYTGGEVIFRDDLKSHLLKIEDELDADKIYHIGTGQSSDSLMWGNRNNLLDEIVEFAKRNQNVILELKTKSDKIDYFLDKDIPSNMLFTWSLNPQTIISEEEHFTASLKSRLNAAKKISENGAAVGFHFHPMIKYLGWKQDYAAIADSIQEMFNSNQIVLISMGTLTYIKPVLKKIRNSNMRTKILQMPMEEIAGKFSYPYEVKKEMFSHLYNSFSKDWRDEIFFYMCMEDKRLWNDIFSYEYEDNLQFEESMKQRYFDKLNAISETK